MYSFFQSLFNSTWILKKKSNQFCTIWILHIRKADKWFSSNVVEGRSLIKYEFHNPTNTCRYNDIFQHQAIYPSRILCNIQIMVKKAKLFRRLPNCLTDYNNSKIVPCVIKWQKIHLATFTHPGKLCNTWDSKDTSNIHYIWVYYRVKHSIIILFNQISASNDINLYANRFHSYKNTHVVSYQYEYR